MTPNPPTLAERADELDVAAKIAMHRGDLVFAKLCQETADDLRQKEAESCGQTPKQ